MTDTVHHVEGFESVLKDFSDEQLNKVKWDASGLLAQDQTLNRICSVLIASRQLYALARYALHREMLKEGQDWSNGIEEFLIKAMADKANQPFTRTGLFTALATTIKSFISEEVSLEAEEDRTMNLLAQQQEYDLRTKRLVSGPVHIYTGEVFVVVGVHDKIKEFAERLEKDTFNHFLDAVEGERAIQHNLHQCVKLILDDTPRMDSTLNVSDLTELRIGVNKWLGSGKSPTEFNRFIGEYTHKLLGERIDLLLVRDAYQLKMGALTQLPVVTLCDSIKAVRKTVKAMNATSVMLVPVDCDEQVESTIKSLKLKYDDVEDVYVYNVSEFNKEEPVDAV